MRKPVVLCPGRGGSAALAPPPVSLGTLAWKGKQPLQDQFPEASIHPAVGGGAVQEPEAATMAQGRGAPWGG